MSRKRELSAEETALWRRVADSTAPLEGQARRGHEPRAAKAAPKHEGSRVPERLVERAAQPSDRGAEKRVRRGSLEIAGALDLHGMTQREARAALISFLQRMKKQGARVALVVTGKGGRSRSGDPTPGVLRQRLPEWLAEPTLRPLATGYAQAHRKHGGGGAFYVFVRRSDAAG